MDSLASETVISFLKALGERIPLPAALYLLGGSALSLLGHPRPTLDIDYAGSDRNPDALQREIMCLAEEMQLDVEPVPIEEFIPLPAHARDRAILVGRFGA